MLDLKEMENYFICDSCGKVISEIDEGWFEWHVENNPAGRINKGFRIVHHEPNCMFQDKSNLLDNKLEAFVGDSGVMRLYEILEETYGRENRKELIEIIKRITVKNYERVRKSLKKYSKTGEVDFTSDPMFPVQQEIDAVIRLQENQ